MEHYMCCDSLWSIIFGCIDPRITHLLCPNAPELNAPSHACILNISESSIVFCVVAFKLYHALRRDYSHLITSGKYEEIHCICIDLISFFMKDFPFLIRRRGIASAMTD